MIQKSLQIGLTTLNAASEFDHGLNILRNKVFDQNLEIFELRRTLIDLQKRFEVFNSFFNKLRNNIFYKAGNYVVKILFKLKKIFISILRNIFQLIFSFSKKITALRLINMIRENEILLSIIFFIFKRVGMQNLSSKFMTAFFKTKTFSNISIKLNQRLLKRFNESSNSKKLYKQLKNLP